MSHLLFETIPELQIMVCRQCKHGVHLIEVETHLHRKHFMTSLQIQPVLETVQQWTNLIRDPGAVEIPRALDHPLPILPVSTNGMQCRRDLDCPYIATNLNTMRNHWQQVHGWTQYKRRGRAKVLEKQATDAELQQSYHMVAWQQVFPTRKNSHLVHIRSCDPTPDEPPVPTTAHQQIAAEIKARAADDEQLATCRTAESDTLHDANPWLRMTRWARYLADVHFQDLLDVVTPPDCDENDATLHE
jgi:hypothetical protein